MISLGNTIPRRFFMRNPEFVAREILGKKLVRVLNGELLEGVVVEAEAYFGEDDPASRAHKGKKKYNLMMWGEPGRAFIYNVHNNWLFNVVSHLRGRAGAVLIRALEPVKGIDTMRENRPVKKIFELTNGPGKLSKALRIDKKFNGSDLTLRTGKLHLLGNETSFQIESSHRIGVRVDLDKHMRFFVKDNKYVSRNPPSKNL